MAFDWLELVLTAHREFGSRLAAVEDWNAPTPDSDWHVEHLVRHVIEEQQWVPPLLAGLTVGEATPDILPVGDDLWTEWQKYSDAAIKAWKSTDLSAHVHLSYGTVKVEPYLRQQTSDVTIHTWISHEQSEQTSDSIQTSSRPSGPTSTGSATCSPRAVCFPLPSIFLTMRRCRTS